jgi:ribosome-interacting GTPase 1
VPALTRIRGVLVQLVEIPGLIEGASEGRGGGRALLGVLRDADAMVLCHDASAPLDELETIRRELDASDIALPTILAATKADEVSPAAIERLRAALPDLELVAVSVLDEASLDAFREAVWRLTGLMRVFLRDDEPVALHPPASVLDVAHTIHHELAESCRGARVWGPSARFDGQRVGRDHLLADGDTVEILS